jgi:hypothetical protein
VVLGLVEHAAQHAKSTELHANLRQPLEVRGLGVRPRGERFPRAVGRRVPRGGAFEIAEIRDPSAPKDLAEAHVGGGQFALEHHIADGLAREPIELLRCAFDHELTRRQRAGQIHHGVVKLEHERIGESPDFGQPLFGARPLHRRHSRLVHSDSGTADNRERCDRRLDHRDDVATQKLAGAVAHGIGRGAHRPSAKKSPDIVGQLLGRSVAPLGLLA